ncbi:MAG: DUF4446 family protein [Parcubacteria group bacterium]|nr:DUF4446 family protein [Parcubacteria group bacterium]
MIFSLDIALYIAGPLIVILLIWIIRLEIKLRRITAKGTAKNFEELVMQNKKDMDDLCKFKNDSISYFKNVENRLQRSVQAVETVRFNPFKGTGAGGNQSFSTVFVSEKGDGVVLSSLHSRDRIGIFSKPLKNFASEFEMSEEEKNTTKKAKQNLNNPQN